MIPVDSQFPVFADLSGNPINLGFIYIGTANLDPIQNPISVYWDAGLTIPAQQPIRTLNGYPVRNGAPSMFFASTDYSMTLCDQRNSVIFYTPSTAATGDIWANLASSDPTRGSALVTFLHESAGSVARTVRNKLSDIASLKDFGAVGNGIADDTSAIQNAFDSGKFVYIPSGTYRITQQIVCNSNFKGAQGENKYYSIISKEFNGDAIKCDISGASFDNFGINGNGSVYSGGGIRPRGYNISIKNCRINDTADSPIIVEGAIGSNALAATYLNVTSCFLLPTNTATTYAIRSVGADDSTRPTARVFSNISGGGPLVDFSGMNYAVLENSLGTLIKFDANCSKITLSKNRFTNTSSSIVIYGNDHVINSNFWGFSGGLSVSIDATASGVFFGNENDIVIGGSSFQSITNNISLGAGNPHNLNTNLLSYTFGWYADVTNPTLGNSTTYSYYTQSGRLCFATFGLIRGSTANVGSGIYSFQLPFKAFVTATGTARIKSSSGTYYSATFIVQGGSSTGKMYIDTLTSEFSSSSIAFSTNATIDCSVEYIISPT